MDLKVQRTSLLLERASQEPVFAGAGLEAEGMGADSRVTLELGTTEVNL